VVFPAQGGMAGMTPQMMPNTPGGPPQPGPFLNPPPPAFFFGPAAVNPTAGAEPEPAEPQQSPQLAAPQGDVERPRFQLGFDPHAKAALPFEIPGESESAASTSPAGSPPPALQPPFFAQNPGSIFLASTQPTAPFLPVIGAPDILQAAPVPTEKPTAWRDPPKILHIRCPSGHLVKARSDLLGANGRCPACKKTFELRYEDSIEFQRRTEKILQREEVKNNKAWIAWAFLAAFLVFVGLIALMLLLSR
jgi:hypothetical protein